MNEMSRYVPITKAKNDLLELIRQVESVDESVAITKNGYPRCGAPKHGKIRRPARNTRDSQ